jgi:hypothetical protein
MMEIDVFTLFPEWFDWFTTQRHVRNALAAGTSLQCVNFREHTQLSGGQVDDTPFGGGAGMVLRVDVMDSALRAHYGVDPVGLRDQRRVIALQPAGRELDDRLVDELASEPALTLLCGRYEGFDERIVEHFASDEISIGSYVLSGGELAAMVVCDGAGVIQPRARRQSGVPPLHPPGRVSRLARAGCVAIRPSRADRRVATRAQRRTRRAPWRRSRPVNRSSPAHIGSGCGGAGRVSATIAPRVGRIP